MSDAPFAIPAPVADGPDPTARSAHCTPDNDTRQALVDLVDLLRLEPLEHNLFRGRSRDHGGQAVFGGQVLGQALMAAGRTVADGQQVHSLHGYFLRAGDKAMPIVYDVDRIRDGASFTTRRVVAIQHGQPIFHMSASFHKREAGPTHQDSMPAAPPPESLEDDHQRDRRMADRMPAWRQQYLQQAQPMQSRAVNPIDAFAPVPLPAQALHWMRAPHPLPDDPLLHQALLAYASDWSLMSVAMRPHALSWQQGNVQGVSLDHAMWFHRDFRFDDWLLYQSDSPSLSGARGFCRGSLWRRDGALVASVAQEGLIRIRRPAPAA